MFCFLGATQIFKPHHRYEYVYDSQALTGMPDGGQRFSGLLILANVSPIFGDASRMIRHVIKNMKKISKTRNSMRGVEKLTRTYVRTCGLSSGLVHFSPDFRTFRIFFRTFGQKSASPD